MGCWNETCMVSNLPITWGTEIAMTVVTRNNDGDWYKPNSIFYISPIMFYGKYNDYGTGEECHGLGIDFTVDEFDRYKTKIDRSLSADEIVEKIAREELVFNDVQTFKSSLMGTEGVDNSSRLGFIRKDVLDRILEDFSWEETFYERNADQSFVYHTITYQWLLDNIPATIEALRTFYEEKAAMVAAFAAGNLSGSLLISEILPETNMRDSNVLLSWFCAHIKEARRKPFHDSLADKAKELIEANEDEQLAEFLAEFAKYVILYKFMMESRGVFSLQPNTSQDSSTDAHRFLAKIVTEIGSEMDRERDEENEAWDPVREVFIEQCELELDS